MADDLKDMKARLLAKKKVKLVPWDKGLSTGSTLLNLACTSKPNIGLVPGNYYYFVGDSSSGKTWFCLTLLAEASLNKNYKDHRFIFDNAENGALMDIRRYFGREVESRLEPPERDGKGNAIHSDTVESLYYHIDDAFKTKKPFIYILDSMDALTSDPELKKFDQRKNANRNGREATGSYGADRAKANSAGFRLVFNKLRVSDSILILISQTRDRIGFGAQFDPRTRSGGRALTFFAGLEMWTSVAGHIKTKYKGHPIEQGIRSKIRVKKNRLSGRDRTVTVPIYHSHGIDDIGSCINYLIEWKKWARKGRKGEDNDDDDPTKGVIEAVDFAFNGSYEKLIQHIQDTNRENDLRKIVAQVWNEVEEACSIQRKNKYGD